MSRSRLSHRMALTPTEYTKFRAKLAERAGYRCESCHVARGPFDVHHVIKRAQGGGDTPANCVYLCGGPREGGSCHERTDLPYAKGRLVVTARGDGTFGFAVVTKADKWAG